MDGTSNAGVAAVSLIPAMAGDAPGFTNYEPAFHQSSKTGPPKLTLRRRGGQAACQTTQLFSLRRSCAFCIKGSGIPHPLRSITGINHGQAVSAQRTEKHRSRIDIHPIPPRRRPNALCRIRFSPIWHGQTGKRSAEAASQG